MKTYCSTLSECEYQILENNLQKKKSDYRIKVIRNDDDKRLRREMANNNERRRMKSINTGFENLRKLLPLCEDSEKLTKAGILQSASKYIKCLNTKINDLEKDLINLKELSNLKDTSVKPSLDENKIEMICEINKEYVSGFSIESNEKLSVSLTSSSSLETKSCIDTDTLFIDDCSEITSETMQNTSNNLEQLLAAAEQVERLEAKNISQSVDTNQMLFDLVKVRKTDQFIYSTLPHPHFVVLKPTINPFTEELISKFHKSQSNDFPSSSHSFFMSLTCPNILSTQLSTSDLRTQTLKDFSSSPVVSKYIPQNSDLILNESID